MGSAKKPVALRHLPVSLQFCFTHFETHAEMLAQSGGRHLKAAATCLERINPLSSNLFCTQQMRIDAYPRLCFLRVRLLSMARLNNYLPFYIPLPGSAILFCLEGLCQKSYCFEHACAGGPYVVKATNGRQQYAHFKNVTEKVHQFACNCPLREFVVSDFVAYYSQAKLPFQTTYHPYCETHRADGAQYAPRIFRCPSEHYEL